MQTTAFAAILSAAGGLAQILPELINHATPTGQLPANNNTVADALAMLLKK